MAQRRIGGGGIVPGNPFEVTCEQRSDWSEEAVQLSAWWIKQGHSWSGQLCSLHWTSSIHGKISIKWNLFNAYYLESQSLCNTINFTVTILCKQSLFWTQQITKKMNSFIWCLGIQEQFRHLPTEAGWESQDESCFLWVPPPPFGSTRVWTQGLTLAWQVLYHLCCAPKPFLL
jgi:hypothetical protein